MLAQEFSQNEVGLLKIRSNGLFELNGEIVSKTFANSEKIIDTKFEDLVR